MNPNFLMSPSSSVCRIVLPLVFFVLAGVAQAQFDARVQAIHNAPDPELAVIDLYVADMLVLDDVAFRTASPYLDIPGIFPLTGGIAPGNSTGPEDVFFEFSFTLTPFQTYQFILTGVRDPGDFLPNPDGRDISLDVLVNEDAREGSSDPGMIDVNVIHGITDASITDVSWGVVLADGFAYGDNTEYVTFVPDDPTIFVDPRPMNVGHYTPPAFDAGDAITLLLSGFVDDASNQGGPMFGMLAVFPDGRAEELLPVIVSTEPEAVGSDFILRGNYPNPFNPTTTITFDLDSPGAARVAVFDVYGRRVLSVDGGVFSAGSNHGIQLDASSLPSGSYVYSVIVDLNGFKRVQSGQMALLK